jgi:hypothetical protein
MIFLDGESSSVVVEGVAAKNWGRPPNDAYVSLVCNGDCLGLYQ